MRNIPYVDRERFEGAMRKNLNHIIIETMHPDKPYFIQITETMPEISMCNIRYYMYGILDPKYAIPGDYVVYDKYDPLNIIDDYELYSGYFSKEVLMLAA